VILPNRPILTLRMRILAVDPGAERMGWASLGSHKQGNVEVPYYHISGVLELARGNQDFQAYRMRLEEEVTRSSAALIEFTQPDKIVSEIVPAVGGGNFVAATQSYLANVAVTCLHAVALGMEISVNQIAARTVQKMVALRPTGRKTKGVTKVQVRNGVLAILGKDLNEVEIAEIKQAADVSDACAIGLAYMGFEVKNFA
jgi:hypothetical protein